MDDYSYSNKCVINNRPMLNGVQRFKREFQIGCDIWRETQYPGYFCTMDGRVAQIEFNEDFTLKRFLLMNLENVQPWGYQRVEIYFQKGNSRKDIKARKGHIGVHRIVYDTWKDYLQEELVIDHIDTNPSNNCIDNLQQVTQSENVQRAVDSGHFHQIIDHQKKILVLDTYTGQEKIYNSVKDFFIDIDAPEYMIKHGGLGSLQKRRDYIQRYKVTVLEKG